MIEADATDTVVHAEPRGTLEIPFFRWAFRPLVAVSQRRSARYAYARPASRPRRKPAAGAAQARDRAADRAVHHRAGNAPRQRGGRDRGGVVRERARRPARRARSRTPSTPPTARWSNWLAVTRIGALVALPGVALADRGGRRRSILIGIAGSAVVCAVSACAPNLAFFIGAQVLQRAFLIITATVAGIAVVEEAPEGARAYATSMLALAGGFGFSFSVIILPFADIGSQAWRIPFALGALTLCDGAADRAAARGDDALRGPRRPHRHRPRPRARHPRPRLRAALRAPRRGRVPAQRLQRALVTAHQQVPHRRAPLLEQRDRTLPHDHDRSPRPLRSRGRRPAGRAARAAIGRGHRARRSRRHPR